MDDITEKLASTTIHESEIVSLAGKGLKLDTEEDAEDIVCEIKSCPCLTTLCFEGNTIGIPAAKAIGKALESQPNLKKALWKDMFTGRTEKEIPDVLLNLSCGVKTANACLTVLDLSDNAFGPRGLKGIVDFLRSPSCYTLEELHFNNNGLGIAGAELLAIALSDCLADSHKADRPFCLKTFICGRNRLENEGCIAISTVLKEIKTLERVEMLQNGIYYKGIQCLSTSLTTNESLKFLNLEDNSFTLEGAEAIAENLPLLKNIEVLNFADCLITSEGAKLIAKALQASCPKLRELDLSSNEIDFDSGLEIVHALASKADLKRLILNGNEFGSKGCILITKAMEEIGKKDCLGSLSDDESPEDDNDDNQIENGDDDEENESNHGMENSSDYPNYNKVIILMDFISKPTVENLIKIHDLEINVGEFVDKMDIKGCFDLFVTVSCLCDSWCEKSLKAAYYFTDSVLSLAFKAFPNLEMWEINTKFATCLGLVKSEGHKIRTSQELCQIFFLLKHSVNQDYFFKTTLHLLKSLLSQPKWAISNAAKELLQHVNKNI